MDTITINNILQSSIKLAFPNLTLDFNKFNVVPGISTDYQFNRTISIAKDIGLSEQIVLEKIVELLSNCDKLEHVQIINVRGKNFIGFNVRSDYLNYLINNLYKTSIINNSLEPPSFDHYYNKTIVDFSSPNIAKEMHVGHLRSTIIGESLCRCLEYCGFNVNRVNHVGDWGTQFGMLIAFIKKFNIEIEDLSQLMTIYKKSRELFVSDEQFKHQAHWETVKLQQGDFDNLFLWRKIYNISIDSFNKIYKILDTHADIKGESFYQSRMEQLIIDIKPYIKIESKMKLLSINDDNDDNGSKTVKNNIRYETPALILQKSDGGFTYDTSDMAALRYRIFEEKADRIIYVVDSGQQQHFDNLFAASKKLQWTDGIKLNHVGFGLVLGSNGQKLKTRSGETVKLQDVLDQVFDHAKFVTTELTQGKNIDWSPEMISSISEKISINCIKYTDLNNPHTNNYRFDVKRMLNAKGNTAVYLMYTMARCKSILRKTQDFNILDGCLEISCPDYREIVFIILQYKEIVFNTINDLAPHHLCTYLYKLACSTTKFYSKNRCIEYKNDIITNINTNNIRLINMVVIVMSQIFNLIGLQVVEEI
ncbi:arginyl tRNA-synthetase [Cotonvirus japonicus]|uniref:arginine--tRNA ligase n=1 Tax=Cotonvirus japonicus TaxID=2811091 RepID=A0ABM7NTQ4_9VIRU|nr:arginyl tRNA-synthetase [Cotonvirus japonicus]BCS83496.1 arginyl tRNA-synthetase [Cotonvirus japonicus]